VKISKIIAKNIFSWKELKIGFGTDTVAIIGDTGSGKSSIFEIISWCLFKKSTKKTVKNRFSKRNGIVRVIFDDNSYIDRNTKEPLTVKLNGEVVSQEQIDDHIGCTDDTFMAAIMCNQKRVSSFVNEKTDSGKAKIFADMLGAGIIEKIRSKISKSKNTKQNEYESIRSKYDTLQEQVELLSTKVGDEEHAKELEEQSDELKKQVEQIQKEYNAALKIDAEWDSYYKQAQRIQEIEKSIANRKKTLLDIKFVVKKLKSERVENLDKYDTIRVKYRTAINQIRGKISVLQGQLNKFIELGDGKCPTCGSILDVDKMKKLQKEIEQSIVDYQNKISTYEDKFKFADDFYRIGTDVELKLAEKVNQFNSIKSSLRDMDWSKARFEPPKTKRPDLKDIVERLNEGARNLSEVRGRLDSRKELQQTLNSVQIKLEYVRKDLKDVEKAYYVENWLFNNLPLIKLMFIDEQKGVLESSINDNLSEMGMPFVVKIDTQKELKTSKEIKDEFSFRIIHNDKGVHRNDLSGGEETLLLLAVQFAINDLMNPKLEMEIYDEVFGALDNAKVSIVSDMLKSRANNKQILIVTHKPEIADTFDSKVRIRKKGDLSEIYS